jgi:hypothetical protein
VFEGGGRGAQILCCSQSGNNPQENLARFWLQAKYENKKKLKASSIFLANLLKTMYRNLTTIFKCGPVMAIENPIIMHMSFSTFKF